MMAADVTDDELPINQRQHPMENLPLSIYERIGTLISPLEIFSLSHTSKSIRAKVRKIAKKSKAVVIIRIGAYNTHFVLVDVYYSGPRIRLFLPSELHEDGDKSSMCAVIPDSAVDFAIFLAGNPDVNFVEISIVEGKITNDLLKKLWAGLPRTTNIELISCNISDASFKPFWDPRNDENYETPLRYSALLQKQKLRHLHERYFVDFLRRQSPHTEHHPILPSSDHFASMEYQEHFSRRPIVDYESMRVLLPPRPETVNVADISDDMIVDLCRNVRNIDSGNRIPLRRNYAQDEIPESRLTTLGLRRLIEDLLVNPRPGFVGTFFVSNNRGFAEALCQDTSLEKVERGLLRPHEMTEKERYQFSRRLISCALPDTNDAFSPAGSERSFDFQVYVIQNEWIRVNVSARRVSSPSHRDPTRFLTLGNAFTISSEIISTPKRRYHSIFPGKRMKKHFSMLEKREEKVPRSHSYSVGDQNPWYKKKPVHSSVPDFQIW